MEDQQRLHKIVATAEGGVIIPSGEITVQDGIDCNFVFKPYKKYELHSIVVNGKKIKSKLLSYTFSKTQSYGLKAFINSTTFRASISLSIGLIGSDNTSLCIFSVIGKDMLLCSLNDNCL